MMINVIIADDEERALEQLARDIQSYKNFTIVGKARNGRDALALIQKSQPHVVFLDIGMPYLSGLEVARTLISQDNPPLIIFVTAYNKHAIEAFELNAIDYVLKPYDHERFEKTIKRVKESLSDKDKMEERLQALFAFLEQNAVSFARCKRKRWRRRYFWSWLTSWATWALSALPASFLMQKPTRAPPVKFSGAWLRIVSTSFLSSSGESC